LAQQRSRQGHGRAGNAVVRASTGESASWAHDVRRSATYLVRNIEAERVKGSNVMRILTKKTQEGWKVRFPHGNPWIERLPPRQDAIRSLGSLEHLFWLFDQNSFVHFAVTALISGETNARDWRRALDRLQKRHPILSVCIDGEPGSVPLFRQADATPIPLRIVEDEPEPRWEAEVAKELATPFNPSRAPLIRAVLIPGARDAAFILVAHHSIADGLSLAYAIRDTLDALAGRSLRPLPWLPSQDDMMNVPDSRADGQEQDQAEALTPAVYRRRDNARPRVKGLRLSAGLTSSVRDRARQEGTTVHGALCAALVLASRDVSAAWREIPLRILSPINARPLLDAGESCGVFLGATTSVFDRQAMDFWDIARDARIGVAANQTSENIAAQLSAFRQD
jgi:hypothetical protein